MLSDVRQLDVKRSEFEVKDTIIIFSLSHEWSIKKVQSIHSNKRVLKRMAWFLKYNFGVIFSILLSTTVLVSSLPTSVLVDTKQQQNEQPAAAALNKGTIYAFANSTKTRFNDFIHHFLFGWLNTKHIIAFFP